MAILENRKYGFKLTELNRIIITITSFYEIPKVRNLPLKFYHYRDCFANAFRIAKFLKCDYVEGLVSSPLNPLHLRKKRYYSS